VGAKDDRQKLLEVLDQHTVKEHLVAIPKRFQADVLLQVFALTPKMLDLQLHLLFDGQLPTGQKTAQIQSIALQLGEGRVYR